MTEPTAAYVRTDCFANTWRRLRRFGLLAVAAATAIVLAAAVPARAGGQMADLAVGGGRLWLVGDVGVKALSASSGKTIASPMLAGAAYPLTVALAGGAAWVGSVEGGFIDGTLSRIDTRTGKVRILWRKQQSSVQYVAAGAGSVWALIGFNSTDGRRVAMKVARFNTDGRLMRVWTVPRDAGRMAADSSGCWISSNGALLHIDASGRLHRALQAPFGDVATGAGAVWLAERTRVLRIDERTGQTRPIPTGTLRLGGFQHDLAATTDRLYLLQHSYTEPSTSRLVRIDLRTGSVTRSALIAGIADAVVVTPHAVWVATATSAIYRYDPRTLRRTLTVNVV
ncbi:MAG: hypothetical protein ACRDLM_10760 [Gaiellaceae bacterium]